MSVNKVSQNGMAHTEITSFGISQYCNYYRTLLCYWTCTAQRQVLREREVKKVCHWLCSTIIITTVYVLLVLLCHC
jgi:hypothetical protein